jgi:hypothetical protein
MREPSGIIRLLFVFSAVVSIAWCTSPVSVALAAQAKEEDIDRPGNDYNNFDINVPPPGGFVRPVDICQITCQRDDNCKAWTFVKAGFQGPNPRCWLKNAIPPAFTNNCCVSGVPGRVFESDIDRPGSDYNNFDLAADDPNLCKEACENDRPQCRTWTFVKAGFQGPNPRCWLKNAIPPAFTNNCCTSGSLQEIIR